MTECLRLESCPFINEKGLERIGTHCSHLKEIDLTDCRIDDEGDLNSAVYSVVFLQ
jgi:F-box/leucine-rich repeat protein 2/20